jgi:hypothetical protein
MGMGGNSNYIAVSHGYFVGMKKWVLTAGHWKKCWKCGAVMQEHDTYYKDERGQHHVYCPECAAGIDAERRAEMPDYDNIEVPF